MSKFCIEITQRASGVERLSSLFFKNKFALDEAETGIKKADVNEDLKECELWNCNDVHTNAHFIELFIISWFAIESKRVVTKVVHCMISNSGPKMTPETHHLQLNAGVVKRNNIHYFLFYFIVSSFVNHMLWSASESSDGIKHVVKTWRNFSLKSQCDRLVWRIGNFINTNF